MGRLSRVPDGGCRVVHYEAPNTVCIRDLGHTGVHESKNGRRWWGQAEFPGRDPKRSLPDRPQLAHKKGIPAQDWPEPGSPDATPAAAAQNLLDQLDGMDANDADEDSIARLIPIIAPVLEREVHQTAEAESDPLS